MFRKPTVFSACTFYLWLTRGFTSSGKLAWFGVVEFFKPPDIAPPVLMSRGHHRVVSSLEPGIRTC